MKYIVILGDGMADEPLEQLNGLTLLEAADTPMLDTLSKKSVIGLAKTVPDTMKPGSDVANLSVLGYSPLTCYSGRSPLEALSIGVPMDETDIALRCNVVTISEEDKPFEEQIIIDHSSSEISTEDCAVLLNAVAAKLQNETYLFHVGTSYRHCLIWKNGEVKDLVQPHDVLDQTIGQHLPEDKMLLMMMKKSYEILKNHPINIERKAQGLNPANCCWFWGAGTKPQIPNFEEKTGKKGMMVSAVDLLKGIAIGAGMGVAKVEGANGGLHTNYAGKVEAATDALVSGGYDFVYLHVEAPDEMGHQGSIERKKLAIEYLDAKVIKPVCEKLEAAGEDYRMLIMPDHPTPIRTRTHTSEMVPYLLYDSTKPLKKEWNYDEKNAMISGNVEEYGHRMIEHLFTI
ncbi:MAG: cofactor-independent phosphoglycerate mutase [Lachnospiraceae bacterium]